MRNEVENPDSNMSRNPYRARLIPEWLRDAFFYSLTVAVLLFWAWVIQ